MPSDSVPSRKRLPTILLAAATLFMAPAFVPPAHADATGKWADGGTQFNWTCTFGSGGRFVNNITLLPASNLSSATVRIEGAPFLMDNGTGSQTEQRPVNASMYIGSNGTPEWKFPGTMGMQDAFSNNDTQQDLKFDAPGLTRSLNFTIPKSTINSASLSVNNTLDWKYSYTMSLGESAVWSKESLSFTNAGASNTSATITYVTAADLNGDGWVDLVGCGPNGKICISLNARGSFGDAAVIDISSSIASASRDLNTIATGQLDDNPSMDLAVACADGNIYYLLNQGAGLFGGATRIVSGANQSMTSLAIDDVDNDGSNDIVAGNADGKFYVFYNSGGATFDTGDPMNVRVQPGGSGTMNAVAVADVNMDGSLDLVGADSDRNIYIVLNLGARDFDVTRTVVSGSQGAMISIAAVDVDDDSDLDLIGASADGKVYICLNLGGTQGLNPGDFGTAPGDVIPVYCESPTSGLRTAVVTDVNADGWADIVALGNNGQVYLALNDWSGVSPYYPVTGSQLFDGGQSARSLAAAPLAGQLGKRFEPDIVIANGRGMDIRANGQSAFSESISGPAFVSALQDYVDNATAVLDEYGNPMVTVNLSVSNRFTGELRFDSLAINYSYNALVDFTSALSDMLNAGHGNGGGPVTVPVTFSMESAGELVVTDLNIGYDLDMMTASIDFPSDGAVLYLGENYSLSGHSNLDLGGELFNYTWTDRSSGELLGYGGRCPFTPSAKGDMLVELEVRDGLHGVSATTNVRVSVVDRPVAVLLVASVVLSPQEPAEGDNVTATVTVVNSGNLSATNVSIQVFLDNGNGTPLATGHLARLDVGAAMSFALNWKAGPAGKHNLLVKITSTDVAFTTSAQPYEQPVDVRGPKGVTGAYYPVDLIVCSTFIGLGVAAVAVFFGTTEIGIYMLTMLFLPLYSRIQPEEVLDRFVRGKILGYIRANPGCHYNLIKQDLGLHNGTLIHHLDTLERNLFIRSARDGLLRRFFPGDQKVPEGKFYLSPIQDSMARYIGEHPGTSQADLTRGLYLEPHIVRYHIRVLRDANVLRVEDDGNRTKLFLR